MNKALKHVTVEKRAFVTLRCFYNVFVNCVSQLGATSANCVGGDIENKGVSSKLKKRWGNILWE